MDGRAEGARDLVLAIFRLAVCDYLGLSYGHDGPDRPRACRTRQDAAEAGLFLTGAWAAHLAENAGFRAESSLEKLAAMPCEVIVALGREGRTQAAIDADKYPHTAAMAQHLRSAPAQAAYRRRKAIVEPPNGWIKAVLGFRQFSLRGLHKVGAEWKLVCMALNLRRMAYL